MPFFTSILYPVIGEPPLLDGGFQERLTCVVDAAAAVSPVGKPGTVAAGADVGVGVAVASFDGLPAPIEFIAETL